MQRSSPFFLVLLLALIYCALARPADATFGVDLSYFQGNVSTSALQCLKQQGASFIIIEGTKGSSGVPNPYVADVVHKAKQAGIAYVDVYLFLNFHRGQAAAQVNEVMDLLRSRGALNSVGMFWHDIEGAAYWGTCAQNQAFTREAINAVAASGHQQAIYSSASQWGPIMCGTSEFSKYQLWYAHYDGRPSFDDFSPFGGWSKPAIKQYKGTTSMCGTEVDLNFY